MTLLQELFAPAPGSTDSKASLAIISQSGKIFHLKAEAVDRGSIDHILDAASAERPFKVPNFGKTRGCKFGVSFSQGNAYIGVDLKGLSMTTRFGPHPTEPNVTVPKFRDGTAATHIWKSPDDIKLVLMATALSRPEGWLLNKDAIYLVRRQSTGRCQRILLPNIHENAVICPGQNPSTPGSLQDQANHAMAILNDAPGNADLLNDAVIASAQAIFRWDNDGNQLPPSMEAIDQWPVVNIPTINDHYIP